MPLLKPLLSLALCLSAGASQAAWPHDKPIEMIVGFAAGGGQDVMIRALQPFLEKKLGAKLVVINRPGASGEIAYTALSQAPADGYTFSTLSTPSYLTMQIARKVRFDPKDITPVARLVSDPTTFAVHESSPYRSLSDVAAEARKNAKAITVGGSGIGTDDHLAVLLFLGKGVPFNYVPYPGGADIVTALMGKHIVMGALGSFTLNAGNPLRPIAVLGAQRHEQLAQAPTAKEQGIDVQMSSDRGLASHARVPAEIRQRFADAVQAAMQDPELIARMKQLNLPMAYLSGEDWAPEIAKRRAEYQAIWDASPWAK